jgi:hypothetical protein
MGVPVLNTNEHANAVAMVVMCDGHMISHNAIISQLYLCVKLFKKPNKLLHSTQLWLLDSAWDPGPATGGVTVFARKRRPSRREAIG